MKVAVISGGRSSEHEVSLNSGASVAEGLEAAGHDVLRILIERDGRWLRDGTELYLRAAGGLEGVDVAFPVLHGPFGEDGTVQGLLEVPRRPVRGSERALGRGRDGQADLQAPPGVPRLPAGGVLRRQASRAGASRRPRWACRSG